MREIEGVAWRGQEGRQQRLRTGQEVRAGESVSLEQKARATLATVDGLSLDLGAQARFEAVGSGPTGDDLDLRVDAGTLGVQLGERPGGARVSVLLGDLRSRLQPGRFFFENSAGPMGVAIACAYEGSVTLGSDWGAAGQLRKGECVALEGLSGSGPILLRSIAMVPEWNAAAASANTPGDRSGSARSLPAVVEPRPAAVEAAQKAVPGRPSGVAPSAMPDATARSRSTERWIVNVASFPDPADAREMADRLRRGGFEVALREDLVRGAPSFRTVISGLENEEAARKIVERLDREYGYRSAWVLRSR